MIVVRCPSCAAVLDTRAAAGPNRTEVARHLCRTCAAEWADRLSAAAFEAEVDEP